MDEDEYVDMMGDFLGAFEDDDDDEYEDDELGAFRRMAPRSRRIKRARRIPARGGRALARYADGLKPSKFAGSPPRGARQWPLGFPVANFVNAGPTTIVIAAAPQRVFKGERLVISVARTGATATGLVTLDALSIGAVDQRIATNPLPAEAYAPTAFGVNMHLDPASPGIDISLSITLGGPALGVADTVSVSAMILGASLS